MHDQFVSRRQFLGVSSMALGKLTGPRYTFLTPTPMGEGSIIDAGRFPLGDTGIAFFDNAVAVRAAILAAVSQRAAAVMVPARLLPYAAHMVQFDRSVEMVREGGTLGVHDWRAYGAVGDGAADDTAAINEALSRGGISFGPPGRYKATGHLNAAANSVIAGAGIGSTIVEFPTNGARNNLGLRIDGVPKVSVSDLTLRETNVVARTGLNGVLTIANTGAADVNIQRVECANGSGVGIMVTNRAVRVALRDNVIHGNAADGIHVNYGSSDIVISCNRHYNNGDDDIALVSEGFSLTGPVTNALVFGNFVGNQNRSRKLGSGIVLMGARGASIIGNTIRNAQATGVVVSAWIRDPDFAVGGAVNVTGNDIDTVGLAGGSFDGIAISDVRDVAVQGNRIRNATRHGISIASTGIDVTVTDNRIRDVEARGISIQGTTHNDAGHLSLWTEPLLSDGETRPYVCLHNLVLSNNEVGKSGLDGIYARGTPEQSIDGLSLSGNCVWDANSSGSTSSYGIRVEYARGLLARGNAVGPAWQGAIITPVRYDRITDSPQGRETLSNGSASVLTSCVGGGDAILLSRLSASGTPGHLYVNRIIPGIGFDIASSSSADSSVVYWEIAR